MNELSRKYRHKIKTVQELREIIGPRPRSKTVVMCHGVFDLVHPGIFATSFTRKTRPTF